MKKEFIGNGKGMRPVIGYNPKNWYANFDSIAWSKQTNTKKKIKKNESKYKQSESKYKQSESTRN
jgi:hypothetical protein